MSFTHQQIWRGIDRLAAKHDLTASGLAIRAGLDPTAFNISKRVTREGRRRWPGTETLAKVLDATGASLESFSVLMRGGNTAGRKNKQPAASVYRLARCRRAALQFLDPAHDPNPCPLSVDVALGKQIVGTHGRMHGGILAIPLHHGLGRAPDVGLDIRLRTEGLTSLVADFSVRHAAERRAA